MKFLRLYTTIPYRLSIRRNIQGVVDVYSLPGKPSIVINNLVSIGNSNVQQPYPNPAKIAINLPYQLKQGETSAMHIYNTNGQLGLKMRFVLSNLKRRFMSHATYIFQCRRKAFTFTLCKDSRFSIY